jgi:hypothetical protein
LEGPFLLLVNFSRLTVANSRLVASSRCACDSEEALNEATAFEREKLNTIMTKPVRRQSLTDVVPLSGHSSNGTTVVLQAEVGASLILS